MREKKFAYALNYLTLMWVGFLGVRFVLKLETC